MESRLSRKGNNADWESSFTHILQRTRTNLDKIALKPVHSSHNDHNYSKAFAPLVYPEQMSRMSPTKHFDLHENDPDGINRAHNMASFPSVQKINQDEILSSLESTLVQKYDATEENMKKESAALKERMLAGERTSEHCINSIDSHSHEIKELQRIYANQALQISRQSSMLDGINQELDSRRSQISKMDSWIRQEEIWRHDIEEQLNVLNKRVKSIERSSKENKESVAEINMKMDSMEILLHSNGTLSTTWTAKTESFMRRMEKQWSNIQASKVRDDEEEEEFNLDNDANNSFSIKGSPSRNSHPTRATVKPSINVDIDDIFASPPSALFKGTILHEVEMLLGNVENKLSSSIKANYQSDISEATRHMRIEIQNYLYRMSADAGIAPPSFDGSNDSNSYRDGKSQFGLPPSPVKRDMSATTTYGKVALSQQVDAMHYRLEDMCSAVAVVKEDSENNHSSLQHAIHSIENRLDEINITNQANVGSIQNRSVHIEEIVRSFELQFYKLLSESKEDLFNKIRDNSIIASEDRSLLDRRVAIMENIISTFSEKNKVSNDAIDAYFASSKDVKKFEMNCVKMEGFQVELKHVREESRSIATTLTRFTSQTPRMDDILEMRERLSNIEPIIPQVSSLQSAFTERMESNALMSQLVRSVEDRCNKTADQVTNIQSTITSSLQASLNKHGHDLVVLDSDLKRLNSSLQSFKDSVQSQSTSTSDKWDNYKKHVDDKLSKQQDNAKASLQAYNSQIMDISKRQDTLATDISNRSSQLQKLIMDSQHAAEVKWQQVLLDNIGNLQAQNTAQFVNTNASIDVLRDDLIKLVQSELQHSSEMQNEQLELLQRISKIENHNHKLESTMHMQHEVYNESSKQTYAEIYNRISDVEGGQHQLQRSVDLQQQQHSLNLKEVQKQLVEQVPQRNRRMSNFSQLDGTEAVVDAGAAGNSPTNASGNAPGMYNGRRMSNFSQLKSDESTDTDTPVVETHRAVVDNTPSKGKAIATKKGANNQQAKPNSTQKEKANKSSPTPAKSKKDSNNSNSAHNISPVKHVSSPVSPRHGESSGTSSVASSPTPVAPPVSILRVTPASPAGSVGSHKSLKSLFGAMDDDAAALDAELDLPIPPVVQQSRRVSRKSMRASRRGTEYYDPDSHYSDESFTDDSEFDDDDDDENNDQHNDDGEFTGRKKSISFSESTEYISNIVSDSNDSSAESTKLTAPVLPAPSPKSQASPTANNKRRGTVYFDAEANAAAEDPSPPKAEIVQPKQNKEVNNKRRGTVYFDAEDENNDDAGADIPSLNNSTTSFTPQAPQIPNVGTPMFSPVPAPAPAAPVSVSAAPETSAPKQTVANNKRRGTVYFDAEDENNDDAGADIPSLNNSTTSFTPQAPITPSVSTPMFSPTPAATTTQKSPVANNKRRGTVYFDAEDENNDDAGADIPSLNNSTTSFTPQAPQIPNVGTPMFSPVPAPAPAAPVSVSAAPETSAPKQTVANNKRRGTVYFDAEDVIDQPVADQSIELSQEDRDILASMSGSIASSSSSTVTPSKTVEGRAVVATATMLGELRQVLDTRNSGPVAQPVPATPVHVPVAAVASVVDKSGQAGGQASVQSDADSSDFETPSRVTNASDSGTEAKLSIKERLKLRADKNKKK